VTGPSGWLARMTTTPITPAGETPDVGVPAHLAQDMTMAEQGEWIAGYMRRHRVSRRSALKGAAGSLGVLAMTATPFGRAAVAGTRAQLAATTTGSYNIGGRHIGFGEDPSSSMWLSGELFNLTGGRVDSSTGRALSGVAEYGLTTAYGASVPIDLRELTSSVPAQGGGVHALEQFFAQGLVTGLQPGTTYHWRFRLADGSTTPDATFATAPAPGATAPFTFTAFADHGVNYDATAATPKPDTAKGVATDDYYTATDITSGQTGNYNHGGDPNQSSRYSDNGTPNRTALPAASLVDVINKQGSVFQLVGGDIAYADPSGNGGKDQYPNSTGGVDSGFDKFDPSIWSAYFGQIESSAASTPWMYATGNHDMEALYDGNTAGTGTGAYKGNLARINLLGQAGTVNADSPSPSIYAFRYGNVAVVAVDCNDLSNEIVTNKNYSQGAQVRWLDKTLRTLRQDVTVDFIVAFFHHCAFSTSATHHSDGGVRSAVAPLFHAYQVDAVFQGHNHQFERTSPLYYENGSYRKGADLPDGGTVGPEWKGTTYLTIGSAGRPRYRFDPQAPTARTSATGATERYRGNPNAQGTKVISSAYWADGGTAKGALVDETVDWSEARYDDYAVCAVDVVPAANGSPTTMTIRTLNDFGSELDRVTLARTAGLAPASLPEAPVALLLPAAGLLVAGGAYALHRRRTAELSVPGAV